MMIFKRGARIGFPHRPDEIGGPGTFQVRLSLMLRDKGWDIVYPDSEVVPDIVFVVGGTSKLRWLRRCKKAGSRIIHRLDGINWLHHAIRTPLAIRLRQDVRNRLMSFIRNTFANYVVYQSNFVRTWWHDKYGSAPCSESVIYNGVDLSIFCPHCEKLPEEKPLLLCVEANLQADRASIHTLEYLTTHLFAKDAISKTVVYGCVSDSLASRLSNIKGLELGGIVPRDEIHKVYTNAVYLSLDLNAACPNSAIEALASGIPVVGFDTGALRELISPGAGIIVPYGGNPWKLHTPDVSSLEAAVLRVLTKWDDFSRGARIEAERKFGLDNMVDLYLATFEDILNRKQ